MSESCAAAATGELQNEIHASATQSPHLSVFGGCGKQIFPKLLPNQPPMFQKAAARGKGSGREAFVGGRPWIQTSANAIAHGHECACDGRTSELCLPVQRLGVRRGLQRKTSACRRELAPVPASCQPRHWQSPESPLFFAMNVQQLPLLANSLQSAKIWLMTELHSKLNTRETMDVDDSYLSHTYLTGEEKVHSKAITPATGERETVCGVKSTGRRQG